MYYLRKEPHTIFVEEKITPNGKTIPAFEIPIEDRAIFKDTKFYRFYRKEFKDKLTQYTGMKLYTCKTLKQILKVRDLTHLYCNEWFDVYDENGKVDLNNE